MKIFKESEQYIQEKSSIVSTIKAALSIFPLGAPIVSIFNDWQNQIQIRTIESTIVKCFEKISAIEESINIAYLHSNEFIYDLKQTIFKVKDEINEERKQLYADYLTGCCLSVNTECKNKRIYLELISRIEILDLVILKNAPNDYYHNINIIDKIHSDYIDIEKSDIRIHVLYLESIGLLKKVSKEQYDSLNKRYKDKPLNYYAFYKTDLAKGFIQFMKMP